MYSPKHFQEHDEDNLIELIAQYPFASLITYAGSDIKVDHLPFYLEKKDNKKTLFSHIAKANPLWKSLKNGSEALIIFSGPNCYISPNYYPTKQENGRVVPTWNYVAVHVKGSIRFIHEDKSKLSLVSNLTNLHEAEQKAPWSVNDAPSSYIDKMLSAIVGIEIEVTSMLGKRKVSQNQSESNQQGVIKGLLSETDPHSHKMAELVKTN